MVRAVRRQAASRRVSHEHDQQQVQGRRLDVAASTNTPKNSTEPLEISLLSDFTFLSLTIRRPPD